MKDNIGVLVFAVLIAASVKLTRASEELRGAVRNSFEGLCAFSFCYVNERSCVLKRGVPICVDERGREHCQDKEVIVNTSLSRVCSTEGETFRTIYEMADLSCRRRKVITMKHMGQCRKNERFQPCSKEGICRYSDPDCCCQLHNGVPKCLIEGRFICHPTIIPDNNPSYYCANNHQSYPGASFVLAESCFSNRPLIIVAEGRCAQEAGYNHHEPPLSSSEDGPGDAINEGAD